ncbi:MAG: DUF1732 domain-containing protein, partial [Bacteroidales bacterium]|nr:DUF1732 domain-containing protein [Bacteroidales bacterium]
MIRSMTGYGKAECLLGEDKYLIEIRSLNGKNADVTLKTPIIPRNKEMEVRQLITQSLNRGNIDLFATVERNDSDNVHKINKSVLLGYYTQIKDIMETTEVGSLDRGDLLATLLRMPEIFDANNRELTEDEWNTLFDCIKTTLKEINIFREKEGESLRIDLLRQVDKIESYIPEVEKYEKERIDNIRQRMMARIEEQKLNPDHDRLEQEMIFYIEKLDINEEKVRLRQHCKYFRETMENGDLPGRKLGFI